MQVLQLSTGATEIVADVQDFSQLLEKYLGHEVAGCVVLEVGRLGADGVEADLDVVHRSGRIDRRTGCLVPQEEQFASGTGGVKRSGKRFPYT